MDTIIDEYVLEKDKEQEDGAHVEDPQRLCQVKDVLYLGVVRAILPREEFTESSVYVVYLFHIAQLTDKMARLLYIDTTLVSTT